MDRAVTAERERVAQITTLCATAQVPALAGVLVKEGVSVADASGRIEEAKGIKEAVARARKTHPQIEASIADQYIAAGARIETVKAAILDKQAAIGEATSIKSGLTPPVGTGDTTAINDAWKRSIARANKARVGRTAA